MSSSEVGAAIICCKRGAFVDEGLEIKQRS